MAPTTFRFKYKHDYVQSTADAMKFLLRNSASVLNNSSSQKPNTTVTVLSVTKNVCAKKYKQHIIIQHIVEVNASPWHKSACFKILCTAAFSALESNVVANEMDFVSSKIGIDVNKNSKICFPNVLVT